jgi:hypothetical protein
MESSKLINYLFIYLFNKRVSKLPSWRLIISNKSLLNFGHKRWPSLKCGVKTAKEARICCFLHPSLLLLRSGHGQWNSYGHCGYGVARSATSVAAAAAAICPRKAVEKAGGALQIGSRTCNYQEPRTRWNLFLARRRRRRRTRWPLSQNQLCTEIENFCSGFRSRRTEEWCCCRGGGFEVAGSWKRHRGREQWSE